MNPHTHQNPKMPRKMRTAEIPAWVCLTKPFERRGQLCATQNPAGTRYCTECNAAFWCSSKDGQRYYSHPAWNTSLEVHSTIDELCQNHHWAMERIRALYDQMGLIQIETGYGCGHSDGGRYSGTGACTVSTVETFEKLEADHRRRLWKKIVTQSGVEQIMSAKRKEEFRKALDEDALPEIEADTIRATLSSWRDQMPNYLKENIQAVFAYFTPNYQWTEYKSNDGITIGKRIVKEWAVENWGDGFHLNHTFAPWLQDLDNVFHLYAGLGFATDDKDTILLPRLKETMRQTKIREAESRFFKVKWFQKGTMHIMPDQEIARAINEDVLKDRLPNLQLDLEAPCQRADQAA